MRTQDEIVARVDRMKEEAPGVETTFATEVLIESLDYEHARKYLQEGVTADEWNNPDDPPRLTEDQVRAAGAKYLEFAFGKATDHRGLSAGRSVIKLGEYAWLLGDDELMKLIDEAPYPQYGVPKLVAFAKHLDLPIPEGGDLTRMAAGEPCRPGCEEGCEQ